MDFDIRFRLPRNGGLEFRQFVNVKVSSGIPPLQLRSPFIVRCVSIIEKTTGNVPHGLCLIKSILSSFQFYSHLLSHLHILST